MSSTAPESAAPPNSLRRSLLVILYARTVVDTAFRAVYPFLPFIAQGLNVSFETAALLIQTRNLVGFAAPVFGPISDHFGRKAMMLVGLAVVALASLALVLGSPFWVVVALMAIISLGLILFVPAQQAFFGDRVPYAQRGRVIAIAEISWSLAAIVGLPLVGVLIETTGWRYALAAVGAAGVLALLLIWVFLPGDEGHRTRAGRIGSSYRGVIRSPLALPVIFTAFTLAATNENVNVIFGEWMQRSFHLDAVALGFVAAAIGAAELSGELFAVGFVDRIGKWRTVAGCLVLSCVANALLPMLGANAILGTVGLFLVYFVFELAIVALIPLVSEIMPQARATLLSLGIASVSLGRALGSFTGPALYSNFGFAAASLTSAGGLIVAILVWFLFVREHHAAAPVQSTVNSDSQGG